MYYTRDRFQPKRLFIMKINEIDQIPQSEFTSNYDFDVSPQAARAAIKTGKPLPGYPGYFWRVNTRNLLQIFYDKFDYDADRYSHYRGIGPAEVAYLSTERTFKSDGKKFLSIDTVAVHPQYRNLGLGTMLYLITMKLMKYWIIAGTGQTPAGRRAWMKLYSTPGVQVDGVIIIDDKNFDTYANTRANTRVNKLFDNLMNLGFNQIALDNGYRYFTYPVEPGKGHLKSAAKQVMINTYGNYSERDWPAFRALHFSLVARWVG